jgi:hypothetical protein
MEEHGQSIYVTLKNKAVNKETFCAICQSPSGPCLGLYSQNLGLLCLQPCSSGQHRYSDLFFHRGHGGSVNASGSRELEILLARLWVAEQIGVREFSEYSQ